MNCCGERAIQAFFSALICNAVRNLHDFSGVLRRVGVVVLVKRFVSAYSG
ncbi:MAG: hypothetical protein HQL90_07220 [Magnetococcales bacterium]|nr:hypothetical protein [Magnetococcales bacterium]